MFTKRAGGGGGTSPPRPSWSSPPPLRTHTRPCPFLSVVSVSFSATLLNTHTLCTLPQLVSPEREGWPSGCPEECAVCRRQKQPFDGTGEGGRERPTPAAASAAAETLSASRGQKASGAQGPSLGSPRCRLRAWSEPARCLHPATHARSPFSVARSLSLFPPPLWAVVEAASRWEEDRLCCRRRRWGRRSRRQPD